MKALIALLLLGTATPGLAQHSGHEMPVPAPTAKPAPTPTPQAKPAPNRTAAPAKKAAAPAAQPAAPRPKPAATPAPPASAGSDQPAGHGAMDHGAMDHGGTDMGAMGPGPETSEAMDHSRMDHGAMRGSAEQPAQMDHGSMDTGAMGAMAAPIPEAPPPPAAGSGPARAADAIWGADAMRASREKLRREQGGQLFFGVFVDRFEYRIRHDRDGYLWDIDSWYGGDVNRIWVESEGEGSFGEDVDSAELQVLYGRAIGPWFDFQAGVRQDLTGPARTYLDIGLQGLAPYLFEVEADAFVSNKGDLTARAEVELDQRITQRLILQPRGEVSLAAQDVPELEIGAGIDTVELGLRLRYEFAREFAPYVGVEQEWKIGDSADFARASGNDPSVTNFVLGLRVWF